MARRMASVGLVIVALAASWSCGAAEFKPGKGGWPQWRGPNRDGLSPETGLLREWSGDGPRLLWNVSGAGRGYSSVAIADGKLFTLGDRGEEECLIAFDVRDGHELWATRIGGNWGDGGARCTPTVDGGRLYATTPHGDLVALDAAKGKLLWRKSFSDDFGGRMMSGWGFCESPLIDGDRLICTPGGPEAALVALDKKSGEVIWKSVVPNFGNQGNDGAGYSSVVISNACGVKQYVQLMGRGVVGVAAKDGKFLWGYGRIANGTANIPTPIVRGDYVFCSTGYGAGAALLKLTSSGGGVDAQEVWFLDADKLQNHHGGMVLIGDYLYGGHGHNNGFPICVKFETGEIVWSEGRGPGEGSAAVIAADGNLYFRYDNGLMALIEATPDGYREHGTFEIPNRDGPSWSLPVVAGGKLYLREQDHLMCYQLRAGS